MLELVIGGAVVLGLSLMWWQKSRPARQIRPPEIEVVPPDPVDFESLPKRERSVEANKGGEVIR